MKEMIANRLWCCSITYYVDKDEQRQAKGEAAGSVWGYEARQARWVVGSCAGG